MEAAVYLAPKKIEVRSVPTPSRPSGGALIKVHSAAICGSDLRAYLHGSNHCTPPWIVGHEVAGEVIDCDQNTSAFRVGDRVTVAAAIPCGTCTFCVRGWGNMCVDIKAHGTDYPGGFAEFMAVNAAAIESGALNPIPNNISFDSASITEPLACVLNGHELLKTSLGDTVVVLGAGPIGCLHVNVARARGATKIIQVEANSHRLASAASFGADHLIDGSKEDVVGEVKRITDGLGASVVIVACGNKQAISQAIEMAASRGRISLFGGLPKTDGIVAVDVNAIHYRELTVVGAFSSSPRQNKVALSLISSGRINVQALISHRMPLSDIEKGFQLMLDGKALKVVLNP